MEQFKPFWTANSTVIRSNWWRGHVSVCDNCAALLAETEEESAFAFAALDGELNQLVPTERIRTNLYERIAAEKKTILEKNFRREFQIYKSFHRGFRGFVFSRRNFHDAVCNARNSSERKRNCEKRSGENCLQRKNDLNSEKTSVSNSSKESEKTPVAPRIEKASVKTDCRKSSVDPKC